MICICIAHKNYDQCRRILKREECAELRLDLLDLTKGQVKRLFMMPVKIVATCREGKFSDNDRMVLLETGILSGATYLDIEIEMPDRMKKSLIQLARENDCKVIISYHNFAVTPPLPELRSIIEKCREAGADIVKIACQIVNASDVVNLLSLYTLEKNIISFGMGMDGLITRIAAPLMGAEFTYASADKDNKTGPGQVTIKEMRSFYRILGYEK
jgi:3-dehydroquinate dehydratase-1